MRRVHLAIVCLVLAATGCSGLPRIVFLHDPLTPREHLRLATAYESEGKWDLARSQYLEALRTEPKNSNALLGLAHVDYRSGRTGDAEEVLERLLKVDPKNAMAANDLAWLYASSGRRLDRAKLLALQAVTEDPDHAAGAYDTLARVQIALGDVDQALISVERGLALADLQGEPEVKRALAETRTLVDAALGKASAAVPESKPPSGAP